MVESRPYTGFDKTANSRREGTEQLIKEINKATNNGMWHNGSWVVRNKRGKSSPSVHGTGRAFDISWRDMGTKGNGDYEMARKVMDFLVEHAEKLGVEAVYDYWPKPFGRGWKCDRQRWTAYDRKVMALTPGGDWVHVEISNEFADDADHYAAAVTPLWGGSIPLAEGAIDGMIAAPAKPRKTTCKKGSKGKATQYMQELLNSHACNVCGGATSITADGAFGPQTEQRVKAFQHDHALVVDGVCGSKTWAVLES